MESRESKGLEIAKHASIAEMQDGSFSVPSQSNNAVSYVVKVIGKTWICDCPDFVKPHQALKGKTPAQFAAMPIEGRNKWLELTRQANFASEDERRVETVRP